MTRQSLTKAADGASEAIAKAVSFLLIILAVIVVYEVIKRNLFHAPTVWVLSLSYQLYAAIFMLGGAYTLRLGAHVRIGFLSEGWSEKRRAAVEIVFYVVLFFPLVIAFIITGTDWAWDAWVHWELEPPEETLWMEPIYPFKTILPVAFYLLFLQGVAEFVRKILILTDKGDR